MAHAAAGAAFEQLARVQYVMAVVNHHPTMSTPGDIDCLLHTRVK